MWKRMKVQCIGWNNISLTSTMDIKIKQGVLIEKSVEKLGFQFLDIY